MFKIMLPFKFVQTVFWPWGGHRHANVTLSIHFDSFVVVFVIVKTTWTRLLGTFTQYKSYWNKDTPMYINMIWNDFFYGLSKKITSFYSTCVFALLQTAVITVFRVFLQSDMVLWSLSPYNLRSNRTSRQPDRFPGTHHWTKCCHC